MLNGRCTWENNIEMSITEIRYKDGDSVELVQGSERELCYAMQSNLIRSVCNFLYTFHEFNSFLVCYWPWKWKFRHDNKSVAGIITEVAHLDSWIAQQASVKVMLTCLLLVQVNSATSTFSSIRYVTAERFFWFTVFDNGSHYLRYTFLSLLDKIIKWTYNGEGAPLLQHTYLRQYSTDFNKTRDWGYEVNLGPCYMSGG
jgi:hypothetical protein